MATRPTSEQIRRQAEAAVVRLLAYGFVPVRKQQTQRRVDLPVLGMLALASLNRHMAANRVLPSDMGTIHGVLAPFFQIFGISERARAIVQAYGALTASDSRRIGGEPIASWVDKRVTMPIASCLRDLTAAGLLSPGPLPEEVALSLVDYCEIDADIVNIRCDDPEEIGSDEIYVATGAWVFDATGMLAPPRTHVTGLFKGINAEREHNKLPLTDADRQIMRFSVQAGEVPVSTVSAMCTISLIEHEWGSTERVAAGFEAAYRAARLVAAIAAATTPIGAAVGFAVALPGLLQSLAIALDGDDELGTIALRFEGFLAYPTGEILLPMQQIKDSNNLNSYQYTLNLHASTRTSSAPPPELLLSGPATVSMQQAEIPIRASYECQCPAPLSNIHWSAEPVSGGAGTPIVEPDGGRAAVVKFPIVGTYRVRVAATDAADGRSLSAERAVLAKVSSTPPQPGEIQTHQR